MTTTLLYGARDVYVDVTATAIKICESSQFRMSHVPLRDDERLRYFGVADPLIGVEKHIKVVYDECITELFPVGKPCQTVVQSGHLEVTTPPRMMLVPETRAGRKWFDSGASCAKTKLDTIHSHLNLFGGPWNLEYPEQIMILRFLTANSRVLELGANVGRSTLVIATILEDSKNLVALECNPTSAARLKLNRDSNGYAFSIEPSALSSRKLVQRLWATKPADSVVASRSESDIKSPTVTVVKDHKDTEPWTPVSTITLPELRDKYPIPFDTLVADCEGALYWILMDSPDFLDGIRTVIVENDYQDISHKEFVERAFVAAKLKRVYVERGGWGSSCPCEACFYEVWKRDGVDSVSTSTDFRYDDVIFAEYGAGDTTLNVTNVVKKYGIGTRKRPGVIFGDPCPGTPKVLTMVTSNQEWYYVREHGNQWIDVPSRVKSANPRFSDDAFPCTETCILNLDPRQSEPQRLNILMHGIIKQLTGGPLCIYHFANEMVKCGIRVRFLHLDQGHLESEELRSHLATYPNLETISQPFAFESAPAYLGWRGTVALARHNVPVPCNPHDKFMATLGTTTAGIASGAQQLLARYCGGDGNEPNRNASRFLSFIQDYEPMIFDGPARIQSEESYRLPHFALFSTSFLRNYFQRNKVGVFSPESIAISSDMAVAFQWTEHQPAIAIQCAPSSTIGDKKRRRLIAYTRSHVARNAYELTIAALSSAVDRGSFRAGEWEIIGVGASEDKRIPLSHDQYIDIQSHKGEREYFELLRTGDIGLSLMTTPHPSLPPLDFAAAGMIVVTNTTDARPEDMYLDISSNFEVAPLVLESIMDKLVVAERRSSDVKSRTAGSDLNWARNWSDEKCYGPRTAERVRQWMSFCDTVSSDGKEVIQEHKGVSNRTELVVETKGVSKLASLPHAMPSSVARTSGLPTKWRVLSASFGGRSLALDVLQSTATFYGKRSVYYAARTRVLAMFGDPTPGFEKHLEIEYEWHGYVFRRRAQESGDYLVESLAIGDVDEIVAALESTGVGITLVNHFDHYALNEFSRFLGSVTADNKGVAAHGLEIGGPSGLFARSVYPRCQRLDNLLFSRDTVWHKSGEQFEVDGRRMGAQLIGEASVTGMKTRVYDYILASHSLEHVANTIQTLREWQRVLKPGGQIVLVLPWRHATFDHRRPYTTLRHLQEDYENKVDETDLTHFSEIMGLHDIGRDAGARDQTFFYQRSLKNAENRCLHHHVFSQNLLFELATHLGYAVEYMDVINTYDIICIYKTPSAK
jgi:FkbM family methyltransferase